MDLLNDFLELGSGDYNWADILGVEPEELYYDDEENPPSHEEYALSQVNASAIYAMTSILGAEMIIIVVCFFYLIRTTKGSFRLFYGFKVGLFIHFFL